MIAEVTSPLVVSPSEIQIRTEDIGRVVKRKLILRSTAPNTEIDVTEVEVQAPWELVEHKIAVVSPGYTILDLSLRFPEGHGDPSGELILRAAGSPPVFRKIPLIIAGWTPPLPTESQ